ncbi:synaptonemal complex central element protein 1 isoform X2 [Hoplias malabaricus]|uniref:synaptonemal complex central element protein 1 isoform X2 n=1 Tax=Hoplias malabaricus TaxID=27720 RepID=UPI0034634085
MDLSFNVEDVLRLPNSSVKDKEPKIKTLLNELKTLQQAKLVLEEEVKEAVFFQSTLHNEEYALSNEVSKLQESLYEKEETYRALQLKCEDTVKESQTQFELKQQKEELVEQYSFQIQETKLRHRKIRMKFENHLQQLILQHKSLCTIFTSETLPTEAQTAEYTGKQLLKAGRTPEAGAGITVTRGAE